LTDAILTVHASEAALSCVFLSRLKGLEFSEFGWKSCMGLGAEAFFICKRGNYEKPERYRFGGDFSPQSAGRERRRRILALASRGEG
jgi:hypothetical protein